MLIQFNETVVFCLKNEVFVGKLDKAEIDFIAVKQENKLYIQVAQMLAHPETERREYGRLLAIRDNHP